MLEMKLKASNLSSSSYVNDVSAFPRIDLVLIDTFGLHIVLSITS